MLMQTFLTKPFLIDCHAPFTEALSSSVLLWHVLQASSSICAHKLKSRGLKSGDCGGQNLWAKRSCWRPTNLAQSLPCVPVLCSVDFLVIISWLMIFRLWNFLIHGIGNPVAPLKPKLRRQALWLRLDAWLLTLCDVQKQPSQTLRSDDSVCFYLFIFIITTTKISGPY